MKYLALIIFVLAICYGCSGKELPLSTTYTPSIPLQNNITQQTSQISGMKAHVIAQLIIKNQPQPKIKAILTWAKTTNTVNMRLTGIGAMGIPVFDYLALDENIYLFLPSDEIVYWANSAQGLKGQDMRLLTTEIRLALWPWDVFGFCNAQNIPCDRPSELPSQQIKEGKLLCNTISCNNGFKNMNILTGLWAMDSTTMTPDYLRLKHMEIFYRKPQDMKNGLSYPTNITVKLTDFPLEIRLELKEIETTTMLPDDPSFDPTPFLNTPALHMDQLITRIKE